MHDDLDRTEAAAGGPSPRLACALADEEIVSRVCAGETSLFEVLMRRHNQRVFRVARAIVRDEAEAEDVMQQFPFRGSSFRASSYAATASSTRGGSKLR